MPRSIQEITNAIENNQKTNVTGLGITNINPNPGFFVRLLVNDASAKTINFYDSASATTSIFAALDAPAKGVVEFGCAVSAGLTISAVSASNLTFVWR